MPIGREWEFRQVLPAVTVNITLKTDQWETVDTRKLFMHSIRTLTNHSKKKKWKLPEIFAVKPKNREYKTSMKPAGQPVTLKWWRKGEWVIWKLFFLFSLYFVIQKLTVSAVKGCNRKGEYIHQFRRRQTFFKGEL